MKKPGRKRIRREFYETRLGFLLQHSSPLEYRLILEASGDCVPDADLIEALSYASLDPFFRTEQFRLALIEYKKFGLYPKKPIKPKASRELRYIKYRRGRVLQEKDCSIM